MRLLESNLDKKNSFVDVELSDESQDYLPETYKNQPLKDSFVNGLYTIKDSDYISIKNGPSEVVDCSLFRLDNLNSLDGMPKVQNRFVAYALKSLTSLDGMGDTCREIKLSNFYKIKDLSGISNANEISIINCPYLESFKGIKKCDTLYLGGNLRKLKNVRHLWENNITVKILKDFSHPVMSTLIFDVLNAHKEHGTKNALVVIRDLRNLNLDGYFK